MNKDEIVGRLNSGGEAYEFSHNLRVVPEMYAIEAIALIEEQAKVIEAITKAMKGVLAEHKYVAPAGNTNCRFCDNDMDHEGSFVDMHEPDCIIHSVRDAIALSKALPSES